MELQGYKTFANRTMFEFPESITAVVGPNGSGKSNVSDAIRWVLGEQSFGLLRARKTEDMIFAGSEQKTRAGMATATIVFDNQDSWLPIDFTDVAISRRAYRDGQNEYFLNGQKVRLKEISELLAQSGLAERTYTIVGQGAVDSALSLKPDERRRFFEEAAGIGLYRSRREEAIQRLETTRRNLERLLDIVGELEPRMASLEKQAKRAQEYERVKADLQLLLREWYGFHWHKHQKELTHARSVVEAQEVRLGQAKKNLSEYDRQLAKLREKLSGLRASLNQWHSQSSELHQERERISRTLAVLDERQQSLLAQRKNFQSDLGRLEEEQGARGERLQNSKAELERLKNDLSDARTQGDQARKNLRERQVERDNAEREVRDTRRLLVSSETKKVELDARRNELNTRQENLKKSQQALSQSVSADAQNLIECRTLLEKATREQNEAEAARKAADEKLAAQRQQARQLESNLKLVQDEINKLEGERSRAKAQLDVLEQAERSFSGLNQGAKYILESAQQGKLSGKYQSFSSQIEVPRELEAAIAAVLGEHLDGILLKGKDDLEKVLTYLEKGDKGRAVLIPEDFESNVDLLQKVNDPDCLGTAAELIQVSGQLKTTVRLLLGQVLIVKDRAAAKRIMVQMPLTARAVTLKGEIFWGNGVVVAGQETRGGMIARPRQKRELQEALEVLIQQLKAKNETLKKIRQDMETQRQKEVELESEVRQASQRIVQCNQATQKANLAVEQVKQKAEFQKNQLASIDGQINRTEEEIKKVRDEIRNVTVRIEELQGQIRTQNKALGGLPLEELQSQVVHWNTQQAVVERAVKDAENRQGEYQNALKQNEQQQTDMALRLGKLNELMINLEEEKKGLVSQEGSLNAEIQALQEKIEPAEQDLIGLEKEQDVIQNNQSAAQQALTVSERYAATAHLDVTRQREALDSLRRRIEDDFGLVAFQYTTDVLSPTPLPLEGFVSTLPQITEISPEIEENVARQRSMLRRMGAVNLDAKSEYDSVKERFDYMTSQIGDLKAADLDLQQVIAELDELMKIEFSKTFNAVAAEFKQIFTRLFGGGSAKLVLVDKENPADSGVEIEARLPGRREQGLALLSGGERSLTAVALIFSLLKVSPTPFCVLDEVDAALDEANVGRFCDLLKELSQNTQFIIITHNRNTVSASGVIYGVTMGRDSVSQVISLKLDEVSDDMVK
jgi:chromosome segregation protein